MAKLRGWFAALAGLASATTAAAQDGLPADLQWGWTPEQLQAASPDIRPSRRGGRLNNAMPRAEGPVRIADLNLRAVYYFKAESLDFVDIDAPYRHCRAALGSLAARYGDPLIIDDQAILTLIIWHDEPRDTRPVLMVSQPGICSLRLYRLAEYRDRDLARVAAGHARPPE